MNRYPLSHVYCLVWFKDYARRTTAASRAQTLRQEAIKAGWTVVRTRREADHIVVHGFPPVKK